MARNKAIFDADILIHLCKTSSIEKIVDCFEQIFISEYVYDIEIKDGTDEKQVIEKLINKGKIKVLYYKNLTDSQKKIYNEAYTTLKDQTYVGVINEGERRTACFANAHKVYYYMSDDNKAAPHIRTLTFIEVINFSDLLFIALVINRNDIKELRNIYDKYILLYDEDKIPKILRKNDETIKNFQETMAYCKTKFDSSEKLDKYLQLFIKDSN